MEQLLSVYTDRHPDVVALTRRLETLREELEAENIAQDLAANGELAGDENEYRTPNPLYDLLRSRSVDMLARAEVLRLQIAQQRVVIADLESKAESVPFVQAEFARLDRDYDVISSKYQDLLGRRESARLTQDRDVQADEVQFRVIDPPEVPITPSGPVREALFTGATLAGLGGGVGVALVLAFLNITYATGARLSKEFGLPVVGSIMRISELNRRRVRPVNFTAFAILLLALPLTLGVILQIESTIGFGRLLDPSVDGAEIGVLLQALSGIAQTWMARIPGL